jgi:putative membrane protein
MSSFLVRWLLNAIPLWLATYMFNDFKFAGLGSLLVAALLFGLVNAVIRPVILLLTLPLTILTLGLFILVVNALMLMFVAAVVPGFVLGGFWTAFWAAIFIAIVSFITNRLIGRS